MSQSVSERTRIRSDGGVDGGVSPPSTPWELIAWDGVYQINPAYQIVFDVYNYQNQNGQPVYMWPHQIGTTQQQINTYNYNRRWVVNRCGQITWYGTNKCLDVPAGSTSPATGLQIWDCSYCNTDGTTSSPNQKWDFLSNGQIRWRTNPYLCLDTYSVHLNQINNGKPLITYYCENGNPNQYFKRVQAPVTAGASNSAPSGFEADTIVVGGNSVADSTSTVDMSIILPVIGILILLFAMVTGIWLRRRRQNKAATATTTAATPTAATEATTQNQPTPDAQAVDTAV